MDIKTSTRRFLFITVFIFFICSHFSLHALNIKEIPREKNYFLFNFTHPFFVDDSTVTALSGVYDFAFSRYIGRGFYLDFRLPIVHLNNDFGEGESKFGDLYLGIQKVLKKRNHLFSISLGGHLDVNTYSLSTIITHFYTTPYTLLNTYGRGLTFYGNVGWDWQHQSGWFIKAEAGPHLVIINDKPPYPVTGKSQWYGHFGAAIGFLARGLRLGVEYASTILLTGSFENSSDYVYSTLTFEIQSRRGLFKPGIFFTFNLNKYFKEFVKYSLGLKVELDL